ncbi:MAG: DUF4301 family protein, partial [Bacteroidales bacterium]|nr:DUF4301 family protein [Bacteroidales bacterium]
MLTEKDIRQIKNKGLTAKDVDDQILNFVTGFPYLNILKPATINDGIIKLSDDELSAYVKLLEDFNPDTLKFVPASGAASRMFKFLFEFYEIAKDSYESIDQLKDEDVKKFILNIRKFAFYSDLELLLRINNLEIDDLLKQRRYKEILKFLLFETGLNYGQKPKGALLFHKYENSVRTAFEEHLIEGIHYAKSKNNKVKIHFTISLEHQSMFKDLLENQQKKLEDQFGVIFE